MSIPVDGDRLGQQDPGAGQSVLVVDDNNLNRDLLRIRLEREGCTVLEAANGQLALDVLRHYAIDLVLLDIMMPVMGGVDTLRTIKQDPELRNIPVIMISAVTEMDTVAECIAHGADDYLTKPFNPVFLKARVRSSLERKRFRDREQKKATEVAGPEAKGQSSNQNPDGVQAATIFMLAKLLEYRDPTIGQHHLRVREYCSVLADHLANLPSHREQLTWEYRRALNQASPLHDIGMGVIPEQTLLKSGQLTGEQRELMQCHTHSGADTLREVQKQCPGDPFIGMAIAIAQYHHERWDGKGYPHGLRGEAIPLCARIVALADVYDALTSRRSYKIASDHDQSKAIILMERGRHFDPDVVDAFLANEQRFIEIRKCHPDQGEELANG